LFTPHWTHPANPDVDGAAKLLNTTSHHFKKTVIIKQYNQQKILIYI